jgi:hypothetical protein
LTIRRSLTDAGADGKQEGIIPPGRPTDVQLLSFPAGKHDDQVDALGLVGQLLDQMVPGEKPKAPEKPKKVALAIVQSLFGNGRMIGCATNRPCVERGSSKSLMANFASAA